MGLIGKLVGTPADHKEEKAEKEVVTTPEFDITQYAKKLGVAITSLAVVGAAALKGFDVKQTEGMVIAIFAVIAAAVLGTSLVMATDLAARAYLTGSGAAEKAPEKKDDEGDGAEPPTGSDLIPAPRGTLAWLDGEDEPRPLLAIASSGGKATSYLVAAGPTVSRTRGGKAVAAIDGTPRWHPADSVRAIKPAKWP